MAKRRYFGKLTEESQEKVENIINILERYAPMLTRDHDSLVSKFGHESEKRKIAVQEVVNFVNKPNRVGEAQSHVVSVRPTLNAGKQRILCYANDAFLNELRQRIRLDKSKDKKGKDEGLKLIDETCLDGLSGLVFVYDFSENRIGLVSSATGKNKSTVESSMEAYYFYRDEKGEVKSSSDNNMFSINKTDTNTHKNWDFIGHFYSKFVYPAVAELGLKGVFKKEEKEDPVPVPPKPVPKPELNFATCALPISCARTLVTEKTLGKERSKSRRNTKDLARKAGDLKGKVSKDFPALEAEGRLVKDENMMILFTSGSNAKYDAWVYVAKDGKTPPINNIFGKDGLPAYDSSKTLDENIASLKPDILARSPYFYKVEKAGIERRKGKRNGDYYDIKLYDVEGNEAKRSRITVKDVSVEKTLAAFFDTAITKDKKFVDAFRYKGIWSDSGVQRMAKTLDKARSSGDPIKKVGYLGVGAMTLVLAGATIVAGIFGAETATAEILEKVYGPGVSENASKYVQVLSDEELAEMNPALASMKVSNKATASNTKNSNFLNYSVVNGVKKIDGPSPALQTLLKGGAYLGVNRDEIVQSLPEKIADYSVIDAITGQPAYRDPLQEGVWIGVAMRIAEEAYKEGIDLDGKVVYPVSEDQVIVADYGNPTAHEAFSLYLEELGVHDTEAVATAYEEAFVEKYNELSATHDQTNPGTNVEDKENFEINDELKQFVGGLVGVDSADIVSISEKFPSTNGSSNRTIFAIAGDKLYEISYNSSENTTNTTGLILEMNNAYENGRMEINGYVKYSDVLQGIRTENDWKRIYNNMAEKLGTNVYGAYIPDPETHNQLSQNADGSYNVEMLVISDRGDMENVVVRVARTDGKAVTLTEAYTAALVVWGGTPVPGYEVYNAVDNSTLENTCPEAFQDANLAQQNPNKVVAYKMSYYDPYDDMDKVGVYLKHENNKADNNQNSVNKTNPERTK